MVGEDAISEEGTQWKGFLRELGVWNITEDNNLGGSKL